MTSIYEVLEYLRVYGRARHKDIQMTVGSCLQRSRLCCLIH